MRTAPTILHLDMDAFFAAAEQAAKPSLRGKAVVVGGLGLRGVVSTASYEARVFGVHSAMPMAQARRLAPNAAYLTPRFTLYKEVSEQVMGLLGKLSPLVEPLSLDEAFVDLEAGGVAADSASARAVGERLRADIRAVTGLTGSVGLAASKMLAKIGSERAKPDGLVLIEPGTERALLGPLSVRTLPGVGPATGDHLRRAGITTVEEIAGAGQDELVRLLGKAHGAALHAMALARDERPVVAERDSKSVSVEDTYDVDIHDRVRVRAELARLADRCVGRLRGAGRSGRTVVIKVRRFDFSTLTRSETLRGPTDDPGVIREAAARLLEAVDTTGGVRLLGVGVTGLADFTQEDLFAQAAGERAEAEAAALAAAGEAVREDEGEARPEPVPEERHWRAGHDVTHLRHGAGWVQGSGVGRVTVRFETPYSEPGRVRTFLVDDPELTLSLPLPLVQRPEESDESDEAEEAEETDQGQEQGQGQGHRQDLESLQVQERDPDRGQASSAPAIRPNSRSGGGSGAAPGPSPAAGPERSSP
ncbi:DNA polymerase IV [Streptomyces tsukubensis]|uniref:DNA polymerase IV n=1 Tax=Streptomyces tsukubensis TaxID=83656 RepID=A0A1V4A7T0_9ACTN|nr:DNA polymerase IV [Streptomyces tsukubensis]OON77415.1 DNA polymerase IV [Streptomyces tsukubensis]QFR92465.1 DNA polymerase IV [Streptomyces tsukubensis]